jgi:cell division septum initiation protein DivIVA
MARTKDAVETFLELGAKYEVVLVGLADDMLKQRDKIREVDRRLAEATQQLAQTNSGVSDAISKVRSAVASAETALSHAKDLADEIRAHVGQEVNRLQRMFALSMSVAGCALMVGVVAVLR